MHLDGHAVRVNGNGGRVPVRRSGPPPRGPRRAVGDSTLHRDGHLELLLNLLWTPLSSTHSLTTDHDEPCWYTHTVDSQSVTVEIYSTIPCRSALEQGPSGGLRASLNYQRERHLINDLLSEIYENTGIGVINQGVCQITSVSDY